MPTRIADRGIATVYNRLEAQRASDPNVKVGQKQVLELLAQIGDRSGASPSSVLAKLQQPGLTPRAQIDLARKGMSAAEKKDLEKILDAGTVPLAPGAKEFLEAVVGRAAAPATHPAGWGPATTPVRPPVTPTTPTVLNPTTPGVATPTPPAAPFAINTNILHFKGPTTMEGAKLKPEVLAGAYKGISAEKFGTTDVLLPQADGSMKPVNVRDMQYDLGNGKVGMHLIAVKDGDPAGSKQMDDHLRARMGLGPNDPIFSLISYLHPEEHSGDMKALGTTMMKTEGGTTHLGAYIGGGRTTNSPENYHESSWNVKGYPANVQMVSLQGVPQGELNKNLVAADTVLNKGVQFPSDYKNDVLKTVDLNTTLQFYRDWIKDEPYLKTDPQWATYCAEHKTISTNIGLNVPHNLESFKEIFGAEGAQLFDEFKAKFKAANGREFTADDETRFEPLWKKEGLSAAQIAPLSKAQHDAYQAARFDGSLANGTFAGPRPLAAGRGMAWRPETTADLVKNFMETYANFKDVGGYASAATIMGFKDVVGPRMGIDDKKYFETAAPILNKIMVAEAMARAPGDAAGLTAWTEKAAASLYVAFGGKPADFGPAGTVDQARMGLAKMCMQGVASAGSQISQMATQPADKRAAVAYGWMRGAIETDLENARRVAVTSPSKTEMYSPPAVTNRVANGLVESSKFVSIKVIATAVDASEVQ
jgi:hypothetical protein